MKECSACLLFCTDFRLSGQLEDFIRRHGLAEDGVDVIRVFGAVRSLVRPAETRDREFLLEQLEFSHKLHKIREIHLINHEDCGAYGEEDFPAHREEYQRQREDLLKARDIVLERLPWVEVSPWYLRLDGQAEPVV